ncbi:uncharacterized protein LOC143532470 [Bidens hawaiensis]|uniref:uncharacterized protein LOC143532470 n=1 Tax=Bidens hawaiensis TaxID=980011 RepID=UPI004049B59E
MTKDTTLTRPLSPSTSSSCFLGCFGKKTRLKEEVNPGNRRRGRSWILSFRLKKSPTKTVPVDLRTANDAPTTSDASWEIQVVEENATLAEKHTMIINRKHARITSGEQKARRKKLTTGGQKETKLAATSGSGPGCVQPGPKTVTLTHPFVSSPLKPLTHSKPLSLTKRQKPPHAADAAGGVDRGVLGRTTPSGREFDSIIGMSIILVILVILVFWGKLCAILCTSSWFFIARRLVPAREHSAVDKPPPEGHNKLDLESEEYKKKVILEGFLQRNHRKLSVGRL